MNKRLERLRRLLNPQSIVFVGGDAVQPGIAYAQKLGFSGDLYAINPRRDEIGGVPCVSSASNLPSPPDVAFVLVPAERTIDTVRDLSQAGAGSAIICSSGFAEFGRLDLQASLIEAAGDMPFLGPNSPGFANFLEGSSAMLDNMGVTTCNRGVAVISNGGAYLTDLACSDRSLPVAMIIGLGNQATVSVADMVDVVLDDERVTAINLYIESLTDTVRLSEVAIKAWQKNIPVVVLKVGKTKAGARAASTHTAALTSDATVASALFRRLEFIEVASISEAMETLKMLSIAKLPKGKRVGFATSSGTYAVMGADIAERVGLEIPALSSARKAALQPLMEPFVSPNNPLDLATAQFWPDEDQRRLFSAFLAKGFDIALQCMSFPAENTWEDESWYRSSRIFAEAATEAGLPTVFVSSIHEGLPKKARQMLIELGVAPLQGFDDGLKAIAHAVHYAKRPKRVGTNMRLPEIICSPRKVTQLGEEHAKSLLKKAGITIPKGIHWMGDSNIKLEGIRYPVALKISNDQLLHKSDIGGVRLNIPSMDELDLARKTMEETTQIYGVQAERFLVEQMIDNGICELLIGIRYVPEIGQTLTIASGGTTAELLEDAETLILPTTRRVVETTLASLKLYPLLTGYRETIRADIDAIVDTIMALCDFADSHRESLLELEINPLIVLPEGYGTYAVDAVMRFTE